MKVQRSLLMLFAATALGAAPTVALAAGRGDHSTGRPSTTPPTNQGTAHKPSAPGPNASLPAKAKAYGKNCQDSDSLLCQAVVAICEDLGLTGGGREMESGGCCGSREAG